MGGKKKASKPPVKKDSKYKIPAMYGCPLCDAKSCVVVRIVRKTEEASVRCRVCGATKAGIRCNRLEQPCDVYFKFRDSVQHQDREYLRRNGIQAEAASAGINGLQQIAENEMLAMNNRNPLDDADDDDAGHYFEAAENAYAELDG